MRRLALILAPAALIGGLIAGALLIAAPAVSAPSPAGLGSSNAPLDISADNYEGLQSERRGVWTGNVEVVQGESRLRTPKLVTYYAPREGAASKGATGSAADMGQVERVEADGPVYYVTPTQKAKGDHATYLAANDTITMTGDVVLVQDKNVATGDKLVIEQKTGHTTLTSSAGGAAGGGKRVRAVLYPNQNTAAPRQ